MTESVHFSNHGLGSVLRWSFLKFIRFLSNFCQRPNSPQTSSRTSDWQVVVLSEVYCRRKQRSDDPWLCHSRCVSNAEEDWQTRVHPILNISAPFPRLIYQWTRSHIIRCKPTIYLPLTYPKLGSGGLLTCARLFSPSKSTRDVLKMQPHSINYKWIRVIIFYILLRF